MDVAWSDALKPGQVTNPAIYTELVDLPDDLFVPTAAHLAKRFPTKGHKLQTWERAQRDGKTVLINDPHWLAVRGSTPLHTDPKYPRYSHQLKIRVDAGVVVRGIDKAETALVRGLYYVLDTHSPHQVYCKQASDAWNITISIDHKIQLKPQPTIQRLIKWGLMNQSTFA